MPGVQATYTDLHRKSMSMGLICGAAGTLLAICFVSQAEVEDEIPFGPRLTVGLERIEDFTCFQQGLVTFETFEFFHSQLWNSDASLAWEND